MVTEIALKDELVRFLEPPRILYRLRKCLRHKHQYTYSENMLAQIVFKVRSLGNNRIDFVHSNHSFLLVEYFMLVSEIIRS